MDFPISNEATQVDKTFDGSDGFRGDTVVPRAKFQKQLEMRLWFVIKIKFR